MMKDLLARLRLDPYIMALMGMMVLASVLPCRGDYAALLGYVTKFAIGLLFFLYGARLSRKAVVQGVTHWRLQLVVLAGTFVIFPALGLALAGIAKPFIGPDMAFGLVFLSLLPSTVQSSIAFTAMARGNVAAALCCASLSNLLGIMITPLLVGVFLLSAAGGVSTGAIQGIIFQLFLPFAAGQAARPLLKNWVEAHKNNLKFVDQGTILLVVYTAFSAGVVNGIWQRLDLADLVILLIVNAIFLVAILAVMATLARRLGFSKPDEITIVFCGSKKSLASGLPMANVLFPAHTAGLIVLPLMLFHQIQLIVCAALARRYARRAEGE
jgi:sodium/bile acid cotransporter 7